MYKQMTFAELHKLSTENNNKFNQNIWTEKLLENNEDIKDNTFVFMKLMEHEHHNGKPVPTHYRTITSYNDNMLIQDMSIEQWDNLLPIDSSMDMSEILGTTYDVFSKLKDEVIH